MCCFYSWLYMFLYFNTNNDCILLIFIFIYNFSDCYYKKLFEYLLLLLNNNNKYSLFYYTELFWQQKNVFVANLSTKKATDVFRQQCVLSLFMSLNRFDDKNSGKNLLLPFSIYYVVTHCKTKNYI